MKINDLNYLTQQANYSRAFDYVKRYAFSLYHQIKDPSIDNVDQKKKQIKKIILDTMMNKIDVYGKRKMAIRNHIKSISNEQINQIDQLNLRGLQKLTDMLKMVKNKEQEIVKEQGKKELYELLKSILHNAVLLQDSQDPQDPQDVQSVVQVILYQKKNL